ARLGDDEGAAKARDQAIPLLEQASRDPVTEDEGLYFLGLGLRVQGRLLREAGLFPEAEETLEKALACQRLHLKREPGDPRRRNGRARGPTDIGALHYNRRQFQEAETAMREGIGLLTGLVDEYRANPIYAVTLAATKANLGLCRLDLGNHAGAEPELLAAV